MNKKIKSTLIMLTAAVIWGFAFVAQCMVDNNVIGNFTFNGVRYTLGAVALIPVILQRKKLLKKSLTKGKYIAIIGKCSELSSMRMWRNWQTR